MGRFDPYVDVYCQNDEVSTVCTHRFRDAKGSVDTPTDPADKLLLGSASHLPQRGILNDLGFDGFTGLFD